MFGAPDVPPKHRRAEPRIPRFGDHVEIMGGYAGLIVDIDRDGLATIEKREKGKVIELEDRFHVSRLRVSRAIPLDMDHRLDPDWPGR